jgi:hypothetical protein
MTSGRAIDHVVLAVQDLDRAALSYQELGFTLTPRAAHEDRMGTSNRLAQFRGRNFIELLEVDRPEGLARHDLAASPPFFSFGDHNRLAVRERDGLSMMVFASDDARADILSFSSANLPTFAPFDFERFAELPDGAQVTVAFSLAFVQSPEMPRVAFFVCENRAQDYFWKPEYQSHANGATGIVAVYLSSVAPERDAAFVNKMFGGKVGSIPGGCPGQVNSPRTGAARSPCPAHLPDAMCRAAHHLFRRDGAWLPPDLSGDDAGPNSVPATNLQLRFPCRYGPTWKCYPRTPPQHRLRVDRSTLGPRPFQGRADLVGTSPRVNIPRQRRGL